jgi:DNA-directed RNA polymerase specialized sigma24 family protein
MSDHRSGPVNENEIRALRREMVTMAQRAGVGADAEDLVQDCLVSLVRADPHVVRSYAFGALYRRIALHWRSHHRHGRVHVAGLLRPECGSWPTVDNLNEVLRLDGALVVLADGELPRRLLVWSEAAPFWASEVVDAIETLLDDLGRAGEVSDRHSRRLRAGWVRGFREACEQVEVELVETRNWSPANGCVQMRGIDPAADRQDLERRCTLVRSRGRAGRVGSSRVGGQTAWGSGG